MHASYLAISAIFGPNYIFFSEMAIHADAFQRNQGINLANLSFSRSFLDKVIDRNCEVTDFLQ